jgi:hypothetical protein
VTTAESTNHKRHIVLRMMVNTDTAHCDTQHYCHGTCLHNYTQPVAQVVALYIQQDTAKASQTKDSEKTKPD